MKRQGFIYDKICDKENIKTAILNASKGKRGNKNVKRILNNIDYYTEEIQKQLIDKSFVPAPYIEAIIKDKSCNKDRKISKPKFFPDQIVHWCLMLQIQPIIMRGMYHYSCGSVPKRGIHFAKKSVETWIRKDVKHTKYCVKMDISKYYPSIDKDILKAQFRTKIKDKEALWLIDSIIDSNKDGLPIGQFARKSKRQLAAVSSR